MMKVFKFQVTLILVLIYFSQVAVVSAQTDRWYAFFTQEDRYGLWADISTPTSAPYMPTGSVQAQSVTTPGPYWMQAGWYLFEGEATASRYYEYCAENCDSDSAQYKLQSLGVHSWGTSVKYEVSHDSTMGAKAWCAWVSGIRRVCRTDIQTAPTTMIAQSEVIFNPNVEVDTVYSNMRILNSSNVWQIPNLDNLGEHFPYKAEKLSSTSFRAYRQTTIDIYLPTIIR